VATSSMDCGLLSWSWCIRASRHKEWTIQSCNGLRQQPFRTSGWRRDLRAAKIRAAAWREIERHNSLPDLATLNLLVHVLDDRLPLEVGQDAFLLGLP
jgi:hypothetical protein